MSVQVIEDYLKVEERYQVDDSVTNEDLVEFESVSNNLNTVGGEIRIDIQNADSFYLPGNSYLLVEGDMVKEDGSVYADTDLISLTINGVMFLFSQMQLLINN
jgi:hypothetical protein